MTTRPVPSLYSHGLTDEQFMKVGKIVMNWGAADNHLGYCLNFVYQISDPDDQLDLTLALGMRRKADLLVKSIDRKKLSSDIASLAKELRQVCNSWAKSRNLLAHGFGVHSTTGEPSVMSANQESYDLNNLDRDTERSNYVLNLSMRLNSMLAGIRWDPFGTLPARPE